MTRFLRAWGWLRWRTFMNAIERSERADRLARFSRAAEALGPVVVAVLMIPSAILALGLGAAAGYGMGAGAAWGTPLMHALRIALFLAMVFVVLGPLMLPSGRGLASLPRLLLLPVSHRSLFAGELLGGLADPWTLLASLAVLMVPVGALVAGDVPLAVVSAAGAILLVAALVALGAFFGALLHMLMRDRKRGEWIAVLIFTLLPMAAIAPSLIAGAGAARQGDAWEEEFEARMGAMMEQPANGALAMFPGELFVATSARVAGLSPGTAAVPLAGLTAMAGLAMAGGWTIWKRTIDRGGISRGRAKPLRAGAGAPSSLPMMRTPARAIAFSFLQHVLRTARGRTTVLPTLIMTAVLAVLVAAKDGATLGAIPLRDGYSVAVFGVAMAFLTVVQLWMNQFAVDKAGLTMLCLQPLTTRQLLRGKMAGAAVLILGIVALPLAAGLLLGSERSAAHWIVLVLGAVAAFVLIAPLAAILSAVFPKHVDMGSIGQKSNAHPAAGLAGGLLIFASGGPAVAAGLVGFRHFQSGGTAVGLASAWLAVALLLHWVFWKVAVRTFDNRRETLIAVATGR
ncbi:MAG TPA: hypothetical protein VMN81_12235 [Vicinamibacterales bacterium]|nr:hypothetical protein [Vicinamibacterales bacterium]